MTGVHEGNARISDSESPDANIDRLLSDVTPDLFAHFASRLENREDAADAVANTLLTLWRKSRTLPTDHEEGRRYAFGIARKVLAVTRRGARRHYALADRLREFARESATANTEPDLELRAALDTLAERDRELVLLVAWEGFSVADAGRILRIRPEAARARYSRARAKLREKLAG